MLMILRERFSPQSASFARVNTQRLEGGLLYRIIYSVASLTFLNDTPFSGYETLPAVSAQDPT